jgi:lipopolysaccharide/colanic/teichoic acid biosynthesis glycosyltransferase
MNSIGNNHSAKEIIDGFSHHIARSRVPSWKRVLDCTLVVVATPVWLPLGALITAWVKLVSPGPALFRQERIGHLGARFLCLKFRTMKVNADTTVHREHLNHLMTSNQPMKKLDTKGDRRLIPGGLWLRTLGVDELPQLLNVLRGEMSLVGPRPTTAYEYEMFQPRHRRRCETLPGLTGLWQVKGKNRTTFEKMMELDITYVETKSFFLDVQILARTLPAILLQVWDVHAARKADARTQPAEIVARSVPPGVPHGPVGMDARQGLARSPMLATAHRTGLRTAPEAMDG